MFARSRTPKASPAEVSLVRIAMAAGRSANADVSRARLVMRMGSGDQADEEATVSMAPSNPARVDG